MSICSAELSMQYGLWVALFPSQEDAMEITEASLSALASSFTPPLLLNKSEILLKVARFQINIQNAVSKFKISGMLQCCFVVSGLNLQLFSPLQVIGQLLKHTAYTYISS